MKKSLVLATSIMMLMSLFYSSCSNASQADSTLSDTTNTKDSSAKLNIDTTSMTDVATTDSSEKSRFVDIRPERMVDYPDKFSDPIKMSLESFPIIPTTDSAYPEVMSTEPDSDPRIYITYETLPEFKRLDEFINDYLVYPSEAKENGFSGTPNIVFTVDQIGHVSDVRVMTTSGYPELDAEAIRVIKKTSGLWTPGKFKGKITKMDITLPITFKIDE